MTAEIAIMNKEAIALASDSAVTMTQERGQKVFTSANKLFTLSKYYPVGIMVYGSADFMGVPWETIIKIYRDKLGKKKFSTLEEYSHDFLSFLENRNPLFPESEQKKYLLESILSYFDLIKSDIEKEVKSVVEREKQITDTGVKLITSDVIEKHYDTWEKADNLPSVPKTHRKNILEKYGDIIEQARKVVFKKLPISKRCLNQLRKIAAGLFCKDKFPSGISGVVIAGFGQTDSFPSLKSFHLECIARNKLKYKEHLSAEISFTNTATIIAFAQKEMVTTFMEGVDPYLHNYIEGYLSEMFDKYPVIIAESIEEFDDNERQTLKERLRQESNKLFQEYRKELGDYKEKLFVDPIIRVVAVLPKVELAAIAESLVNLTLFKQKISMASETVGGPIDVAVISKGDGFIWIKRKHYFSPELNQQFFSNYYLEVKDEKK